MRALILMLKFTAHKFYPGVTLVVSGEESILFGVPNDAFKATKQYCTDHKLPFPRTLVAPPRMVVMGTPQFNPEFFLYDFLFVYGAAFKPQLQMRGYDLSCRVTEHRQFSRHFASR